MPSNYAAERVGPLGSLIPKTITDEVLVVELRTTDDPTDKVHGDWKTAYLKERPVYGSLTVTHGGATLLIVTTPPAGPSECSVDWLRGIMFFDPAETWNGVVVAYQGVGAVVDWTRLEESLDDFAKPAVIDEIDLTAGPAIAPVKGARYIHSGLTGASHWPSPVGGTIHQTVTQYNIYEWDGASWIETSVSSGVICYNMTLASYRIFAGGVWGAFGGGGPSWANDTCPVCYGIPHASAQCACSTAIGHCTWSAVGSVSIGRFAFSGCDGSVAVGACARVGTAAWYSTVVGFCSEAGCPWSVSVGFCAKTCGCSAVSVGYNSYSCGGVSIGETAKAYSGVAIGGAACSCLSGVAVGPSAKATGCRAVSIGALSEAYGCYTVSIGQQSLVCAAACFSVIVGANALAAKCLSSGFGYCSRVLQHCSISIGACSYLNASRSIVIGAGAYHCCCDAPGTIVIGPDAGTCGCVAGSVVIGETSGSCCNVGAVVIGSGGALACCSPYGVAIGAGAKSLLGCYGVSVGAFACSVSGCGVAVGACSISCVTGVSVGFAALSRTGDVVVGYCAQDLGLFGGNAVIVGECAVSNAEHVVVIGRKASVCGCPEGVAIGGCASSACGIAIGFCANAKNYRFGVAIGKMSEVKRHNEMWLRSNPDQISPVPSHITGHGMQGMRKMDLAGAGPASWQDLDVSSVASSMTFVSSKGAILSFIAQVVGKTTDASFGVSFVITGAVKVTSVGAIELLGQFETVQYGGDADTDSQVVVAAGPARLNIQVKDKIGRTMSWHATLRYAEMVNS